MAVWWMKDVPVVRSMIRQIVVQVRMHTVLPSFFARAAAMAFASAFSLSASDAFNVCVVNTSRNTSS